MEPATLRSSFLRSARDFPDRPALEVAGETLSYAALHARATAIAATLDRHDHQSEEPLTAVLGARSSTLFAAVLGALLRGHGYVPLNPSFPVDRTAAMLNRSGCRALVVDAGAAPLLDALLESVERPLVVVMPDEERPEEVRRRRPRHTIVGAGELETGDGRRFPPVDPDATAYLLFTSGSTGIPKGVGVAHRNVTPFVELMVARYGISPQDRLSQTFDTTFDLSVFDMFVAWESGACLCCPSASQLLGPGQFIRDARLTIWFSVPSVAVFMKQLRMLKPGSYPLLRWALFCGEALPLKVAETFAAAAPSATLENLYGPTEATIACTAYRWDKDRSPGESALGVVPIGAPLPEMAALVVDGDLVEVPPGVEGELLVSGPQVTPGYWKDPERTAAAFVVPPGSDEVHYRTGDLVRRPHTLDQPITYLGRIDHQVKIRGVRIELGEVEAAVRDATGVDAVIAVGWPKTETGYDGIVAFVGATDVDVREARGLVKQRLPKHMIPRRFELLEELPVNTNGKFDRNELARQLEREVSR